MLESQPRFRFEHNFKGCQLLVILYHTHNVRMAVNTFTSPRVISFCLLNMDVIYNNNNNIIIIINNNINNNNNYNNNNNNTITVILFRY